MSLLDTLTTRLRKHGAYRRTYNELRALPLDTRLDLDIAGAERETARRAVYG
ncbi:hypothetical protein ROJ8625_01223 [Roseivivax jejudonensis]|uniref:DUF1127 domain-containing protein n=1 Tax=Roseivivax jejudonensis TaxID=1529041 RepID=A0A1X6YRU6_9RHOB|nr:hypothetical protein [Roseivivax jejudonensis]SLN28777.1 hypothetical protein ROJ8625_01223 [Roseivivax jejudonensis]